MGQRWRWLRPMVARFVLKFRDHARPGHREVIEFLRADAGFTTALREDAT